MRRFVCGERPVERRIVRWLASTAHTRRFDPPNAIRVASPTMTSSRDQARHGSPPTSALIQRCTEFARTGTAYQLIAHVARNASSWEEAVTIFDKCCAAVTPVAKPRVDEVVSLLSAPSVAASVWAQTLVYFQTLKGTCGMNPPPQRVVAHMINIFRRKNRMHYALHISKHDLQSVWSGRVDLTIDASKAVLDLFVAESSWREAAALVAQRPILQSSPGAMAALIRVVARSHSIAKAIEVFNELRVLRRTNLEDPAVVPNDRTRWANPLLVTFAANALVQVVAQLPGAGHMALVQQLIAEQLATGAPMMLDAYLPLGRMMNSVGRWAEVLSTLAHRFNVFDVGLNRQPLSVLTLMRTCMMHIDPYHAVSNAEALRILAMRADPTHQFIGSLNPKLSLTFSRTIHQQFASYIIPLSLALNNATLPEVRMHSRDVSQFCAAAVRDNDAIVVLDTNVVLHLALRNMTVRTLLESVRQTHPHMRDYKLATVIVPFTVVSELSSFIKTRGMKSMRVRRQTWDRVVRILQETVVLSFSAEFPCVVFQLISNIAMDNIVTKHRSTFTKRRNPDKSIMNVLLCLQAELRHAEINSQAAVNRNSRSTLTSSFLRFHVRRLLGQTDKPGSDRLVLLTFDRDFSLTARWLGVHTFPRFKNGGARQKDIALTLPKVTKR